MILCSPFFDLNFFVQVWIVSGGNCCDGIMTGTFCAREVVYTQLLSVSVSEMNLASERWFQIWSGRIVSRCDPVHSVFQTGAKSFT